MSDLFAARSQMAISLAFHIVFAVVGIGMPLLMVLAERKWQVTRDPIYLDLAKRWAKGTAIMFAVGAVSGTILSFELGLLWPGFMKFAGPIIGMPFSLEGFAFFVEAIFLGIFLYGRDRISPRAHLLSGVLVAVSGALSGIFVVIANAWMNSPTGFRLVNGQPVDIDPIAAILNPAAFSQTLHMTIAAYAATGLAVAGIHAFLLLRQPANAFHRRALGVALMVGAPAAIVQPISGDLCAKFVAHYQPAKFGAMEAHFETTRGAALVIGGLPDEATGEVHGAIRIPKVLSFMAAGDVDAEVQGLDRVPRELWPNVPVVHLAFDVMVGLGTFMALVALWAAGRAFLRRDLADSPWLLRALALATPMGFLATEAGWVVTEVGRQPWIVQGVLRTSEAVTPMPGLVWPLVFFTGLYVLQAIAVSWLLYRQIAKSPEDQVEWRRTHVPTAAARA